MSLLRKSKIDQRLYKSLTLPNKLSCLLISDADTEKSAAALNVNVGALEDPSDREGLAHFCEHMLFMGTKKYPNEAEYQEFISKNSGETNAYTSQLNTNYIFSIANNSLQGALERFSQFFTEPLFDASCTGREMKAVDSEFNMNLQSDFWRKHQLLCWMAKENNPMKKFMIGNLKTLQHEDTRERLLEFHKKYYSSNVMKLVIYGQQPLDQLEEWTHQLFSEIKNQDILPPQYKEIPYTQESLGKLLKFVPFKDEDVLELVWLTEYMQPHYKNCPGSYISHLIGHEGENSLLSLLIDEGLASELSCGSSDEMRLYSNLNIRIKLTKKGFANIQEIISYTFQYLNVIKDRGVQKWIFDEIGSIKKLKFEYLEKSKPFGYVSQLASRMQLYPMEEILEAPYFMEEFNEGLFQKAIDSVTEKNLIIILSSKEFQGKLDQVEEHFETQFQVGLIPIELHNEALNPTAHPRISKKKLDLPVLNTFLPKNTSIQPIEGEPTTLPEKVFETTHSELWFKRDKTFNVPKALVEVRIYCNDQGYGQSARTEMLARLWSSLLDDHVRELNYLAETAYINSAVGLAPNGLEITSFGFNDSMPVYINQLFKKIKQFNVLDYEHNFESSLQKSKQSLENFKRQPPYQQVYSLQNVLLKQGGSFDPDLLLVNLNQITWNDLVKFQENWLKVLRFEWLISGNIPIKVAENFVNEVEQIMSTHPLPKDEVLEQRTINLPRGSVHNYTYTLEEETNSAVLVYYQNETMTLTSQLVNDLISNILKSPFFSQLRTQEQLGYVVFSMISDIRGITGFNFLIQSNSKSPQYCQNRIKTFINEQMLQLMHAMTKEDFEAYKQSVRISLLEKDYSLNQQAQRYWSEIQKHQYIFDRRQKMIELLDTISQESVVKFYVEQFINKPKIMEIHALAKGHIEENELLRKENVSNTVSSNSIDWIKRRLPLYPDYYSML